jgi:hypothetical protein
MNDERRVAENASVVPLLGKRRDERKNATCETARFTSLDNFSGRRERRSFFEDFGVKTKERPKKRKRKTARSRKKRSRRAQRRKRCKNDYLRMPRRLMSVT